MTSNLFRVFLLAFISGCVLAGCVSVPVGTSAVKAAKTGSQVASIASIAKPSERGGYYLDDGPPGEIPDNLMEVPDAVPKIEPYARGPNRPYVQFGKRYVPITDNRPYKERGYGSWYGKKFHGRQTSSGEPYDMFKMTAAHPTLPIPSYARVTNIKTKAQVVVRINDRGPFHSGRIIDLSYTAALKLGYLSKGSGEVEVEFLSPEEIRRITLASSRSPASVKTFKVPAETVNKHSREGYYIQLGAFRDHNNAKSTQAQYILDFAHVLPEMEIIQGGEYYRLYAGPFETATQATDAAYKVQPSIGFAKPIIVVIKRQEKI